MNLFDAIRSGDFARVKELANLQNVNTRESNNFGSMTPLQVACQFGHSDIVEFLIDIGASLDKISHYGFSALSLATKGRKLQCMFILLQHGASQFTATRLTGRLPIDFAAENNDAEAVKILIDSFPGIVFYSNNAMHVALSENNDAICRLLIENGFQFPHWGYTDIQTKCALIMLDYGVDHTTFTFRSKDDFVPSVFSRRNQLRNLSLALLQLKRRKSVIIGRGNGRDILRIVARHIWSERVNVQ